MEQKPTPPPLFLPPGSIPALLAFAVAATFIWEVLQGQFLDEFKLIAVGALSAYLGYRVPAPNGKNGNGTSSGNGGG